MSYHLGFDGVASTEVTHLLESLERQLNWHAVSAEEPAVSGRPGGTTGCPPGQNCPNDPHGPHNPYVIVIVAFALGVAAGFLLCRLTGKKPGTSG